MILQIIDLKWRPSVWRLSDFFSNFQTCTVCMKSSARVKFTTYFKRIFANCRYKAHREAKVILALLMEGYSNFSISLLTTWNMSPPTLLKDSVFPGPPRHHHTFKKIKKFRLNYLQLVHYLFFWWQRVSIPEHCVGENIWGWIMSNCI